MMEERKDSLPLEDAEIHRRRKGKNLAIGLCVGGLCLLFYLITIVRLMDGQ